jgi:VIT1/CCC1 family predicted Fe2+/Mn2+ transporter
MHLATQRRFQGMITIILVLLILMLIGAIPTWPHSRNWGYGPSGGLGTILIILLILYLLHVI